MLLSPTELSIRVFDGAGSLFQRLVFLDSLLQLSKVPHPRVVAHSLTLSDGVGVFLMSSVLEISFDLTAGLVTPTSVFLFIL